jgi:hypothetical protein
MKKSTCFIIAAILLLSAPKGGAADSGKEIVPEKQISGKASGKTVIPAFKSADEIENMTGEQLIKEVYKDNKFDVSGFHMPDDFGAGLKDGESWHHLKINSASSATAAENEVKSFVSAQNPGKYAADYIGENAYYYQFRLEYARKLDAYSLISMRVIVYKENVMFCAFNDKTGYYSEIRDLSADSVLYLLDMDTFFNTINWDSARIIRREIKETDNEYIYTYYRASITDGDWDLDSRAVLEKIKYGINKVTGIKTYYDDNKVLKEVEIKGTAKKLIIQ